VVELEVLLSLHGRGLDGHLERVGKGIKGVKRVK
jgi:hypothetical protein